MPCVKNIVMCMIDDKKVGEKLTWCHYQIIQLPNVFKILRIIFKMSLFSRLHLCDAYSLQLDESTDVAGLAVLLDFVRYNFEKSIEEDLLYAIS